MLNPIEKFKVAILHVNRAWNHWYGTRGHNSSDPRNVPNYFLPGYFRPGNLYVSFLKMGEHSCPSDITHIMMPFIFYIRTGSSSDNC